MRVGWLADLGNADGTVGGAELTQAEFRAAAPDGVQVVDCPPGGVVEGLDKYVVHNCVSYQPEDIWKVEHAAVKYVHDMWPHGDPDVRSVLLGRASLIFCSPLHQTRFDEKWGLADGCWGELIPPPVDLEPFRKAAERAQERAGAVSVGAWMNPGKAPHLAAEWAQGNGGVDFYGSGPLAPPGSVAVSYGDMPELLAAYKTFVFLPTTVEPFGRLVAEAWAAGCDVVTNRLVGARYWLESNPEAIETAAANFWALVTS